jgi:hypothetical protein
VKTFDSLRFELRTHVSISRPDGRIKRRGVVARALLRAAFTIV